MHRPNPTAQYPGHREPSSKISNPYPPDGSTECKNTLGQPFCQHNYYEHIIRDEAELQKIREYIRNNPLKWDFDEENRL